MNLLFDFCVWGFGGKGGVFVLDVDCDECVFMLLELWRVFSFGLLVFNGSWVVLLNDSVLDFVFIFVCF